MLTERAEHLDTEQEVSGQPSIWGEVYLVRNPRCPVQKADDFLYLAIGQTVVGYLKIDSTVI
jgi:hypothetical protein